MQLHVHPARLLEAWARIREHAGGAALVVEYEWTDPDEWIVLTRDGVLTHHRGSVDTWRDPTWRELDQREREGPAIPGRNEWRRCANNLAAVIARIAMEIDASAEYVDKPWYPLKPLSRADLIEWATRLRAALDTSPTRKYPDRQ